MQGMRSSPETEKPADERRHFHRIATDKPVVVRCDGMEHSGTVRDISLHGLLFDACDDWQPEYGQRVHVHVRLDDHMWFIDMYGEIAHVAGSRIGLRCSGIDLQSASRLRRMIELNLADQELLERELAELVAS
jgi:hypothetical protein